jgi:hypothetical protein
VLAPTMQAAAIRIFVGCNAMVQFYAKAANELHFGIRCCTASSHLNEKSTNHRSEMAQYSVRPHRWFARDTSKWWP